MTQSNNAQSDTAVSEDGVAEPLEGAAQFIISKPVNLAQLESEISGSLGGTSLNVVLTGAADTSQPVSASNTATLWLLPFSADKAKVQQAISAHRPEENWGTPQVLQDFDAVLAKVTADPDVALSDDEMRSLVVGSAFKIQMMVAATSGTL